MREDLQRQLLQQYQPLFRRRDGIPLGHFNFAVGDGWYRLIYEMLDEIAAAPGNADVNILQIKEKFGGLRVYYDGGSSSVSAAVDTAARKALMTCEHCGSTKSVARGGRNWVRTLCETCRPKYDARDADEDATDDDYEDIIVE